jgi:hypothetical protein
MRRRPCHNCTQSQNRSFKIKSHFHVCRMLNVIGTRLFRQRIRPLRSDKGNSAWRLGFVVNNFRETPLGVTESENGVPCYNLWTPKSEYFTENIVLL